MKRKSHILAILFTMSAMALGCSSSVFAYDTESDITVNEVNSVMLTSLLAKSDFVNYKGTKEDINFTRKLKFTLDKPANVKVTTYTTISCESYSYEGNIKNPEVYTEKGQSIKGITSGDTKKGNTYVGYYALEKGSYYVYYEVSPYWYNVSEGILKTTVEAEYINRTGDNNGASVETAIPLTNENISVGFISHLYDSQYFKFKLDKESTVSFDISTELNPELFDTGVTYDIISSSGSSYTDNLNKLMSTNTSKELNIVGKYYDSAKTLHRFPTNGKINAVTLPAGDYYLRLNKANINMEKSIGTVKVTMHTLNGADNQILSENKTEKIKVSKLLLKKGTKKISGVTLKNANIKVKIGKKTYKVKADSNGRFTIKLKTKLKKNKKIKITVTKKNLKSFAKIYKVK